MTEPRDEDINKTIAEFMGWIDIGPWYCDNKKEEYFNPTESLDALIPVVQKLEIYQFTIINKKYCKTFKATFWLDGEFYEKDLYESTSPSRALALAVYEVIKT